MSQTEVAGILEACQGLARLLLTQNSKNIVWNKQHKIILLAAQEALGSEHCYNLDILAKAGISLVELHILQRHLSFYKGMPNSSAGETKLIEKYQLVGQVS